VEVIHLLRLAQAHGRLMVRRRVALPIDSGWDPCFSPDGRWLAYTARGDAIMVVARDGRSGRPLIKDAGEPAW
jgi:hypothetical protein